MVKCGWTAGLLGDPGVCLAAGGGFPGASRHICRNLGSVVRRSDHGVSAPAAVDPAEQGARRDGFPMTLVDSARVGHPC